MNSKGVGRSSSAALTYLDDLSWEGQARGGRKTLCASSNATEFGMVNPSVSTRRGATGSTNDTTTEVIARGQHVHSSHDEGHLPSVSPGHGSEQSPPADIASTASETPGRRSRRPARRNKTTRLDRIGFTLGLWALVALKAICPPTPSGEVFRRSRRIIGIHAGRGRRIEHFEARGRSTPSRSSIGLCCRERRRNTGILQLYAGGTDSESLGSSVSPTPQALLTIRSCFAGNRVG